MHATTVLQSVLGFKFAFESFESMALIFNQLKSIQFVVSHVWKAFTSFE